MKEKMVRRGGRRDVQMLCGMQLWG
jgi:hypothetical protein